MNENYVHPALADAPARQPRGATVEEGILRGMYLLRERPDARVQLLGSGTILREAIAAAVALERDYGVAANVWSVTSWTELCWDAMTCGNPSDAVREVRGAAPGGTSWVMQCLAGTVGPLIAATDYVSAVPDLIRSCLPEGRPYVALGTDGFGRSDTRASLRAFFAVDAGHIVTAALRALGR
jgi:pyruvate dehydrogenase E1 component